MMYELRKIFLLKTDLGQGRYNTVNKGRIRVAVKNESREYYWPGWEFRSWSVSVLKILLSLSDIRRLLNSIAGDKTAAIQRQAGSRFGASKWMLLTALLLLRWITSQLHHFDISSGGSRCCSCNKTSSFSNTLRCYHKTKNCKAYFCVTEQNCSPPDSFSNEHPLSRWTIFPEKISDCTNLFLSNQNVYGAKGECLG